MRNAICCVLSCLLCVASSQAGVELGVVERSLGSPVLPDGEMVTYNTVFKMVEAADRAADRAFLEVKSEGELRQLQRRLRQGWLESIGGFPEKTPLNSRTVDVIKRDGYVIEKVIFESQPQHHVTAYLFLPESSGGKRVPGIAVSCGHSGSGKAFGGYQRAGVLAAQNGMAALVYDPIDQGERRQAKGKNYSSNVSGHNVTGVSAMLLGWNTARFRIWDGIRALDYLQSRKEVDPGQLGVMGNSGGGTLTSYIMAIDDRIKAGAPSCFLTSFTRLCDRCGPQDAEQNLFGQLAFGLNHTGFVVARAPLPVAVNCTHGDFFPFKGTTELFETASKVYTRFGWGDRVIMIDVPGSHGWKEGTRGGSIDWMRYWLKGEKGVLPLDMPKLRELSEGSGSRGGGGGGGGIPRSEVNVTEGGQVLHLPGARSVYDIMRSELQEIERVRKPLSGEAMAGMVAKVAGIRMLPQIGQREVEVSSGKLDGVSEVRHYFELHGGITVPAITLVPEDSKAAPVLMVGSAGKTNFVAAAHGYLKGGHPVMVADLSGMGEIGGFKHKFYGSRFLDEGVAQMLYLLGKSLVGMRAEEIMVCAKSLSGRCGGQRVIVHPEAGAIVSSYHAYAVAPELFSGINVPDEVPSSWSKVVRTRERFSYADCVHGALRHYDWPMLYSKQ